MYNSIINFIENDTTKIKKILEKYLFAGNTLRFEEDLMHVMIVSCGEKACMTEDVVSKQTVKNTIHELEVELEEEIFMRYLPISYKR